MPGNHEFSVKSAATGGPYGPKNPPPPPPGSPPRRDDVNSPPNVSRLLFSPKCPIPLSERPSQVPALDEAARRQHGRGCYKPDHSTEHRQQRPSRSNTYVRERDEQSQQLSSRSRSPVRRRDAAYRDRSSLLQRNDGYEYRDYTLSTSVRHRSPYQGRQEDHQDRSRRQYEKESFVGYYAQRRIDHQVRPSRPLRRDDTQRRYDSNGRSSMRREQSDREVRKFSSRGGRDSRNRSPLRTPYNGDYHHTDRRSSAASDRRPPSVASSWRRYEDEDVVDFDDGPIRDDHRVRSRSPNRDNGDAGMHPDRLDQILMNASPQVRENLLAQADASLKCQQARPQIIAPSTAYNLSIYTREVARKHLKSYEKAKYREIPKFNHGNGKVNPQTYGGSHHLDLGLCYSTFETKYPCEMGEKCPWRHHPILLEERDWIFRNGGGKGRAFLNRAKKYWEWPEVPMPGNNLASKAGEDRRWDEKVEK